MVPRASRSPVGTSGSSDTGRDFAIDMRAEFCNFNVVVVTISPSSWSLVELCNDSGAPSNLSTFEDEDSGVEDGSASAPPVPMCPSSINCTKSKTSATNASVDEFDSVVSGGGREWRRDGSLGEPAIVMRAARRLVLAITILVCASSWSFVALCTGLALEPVDCRAAGGRASLLGAVARDVVSLAVDPLLLSSIDVDKLLTCAVLLLPQP